MASHERYARQEYGKREFHGGTSPFLYERAASYFGLLEEIYRLPNGQAAKFLNDAKTYLGNQLECEYGDARCFGVVADMDFILICTYEEDGKNPELVLYKKR